MKIALGVLIALVLSSGAHAQEIRLPITGQFSNGVAAVGEAVSQRNGVGLFWVQAPGSIRCEGAYDARQRNLAFVVPVRCSNGKRGEVVVTRQPDLMSGTALVRLSNGLRGQFVFDRMTFEQAFGAGGRSRSGF